MKPSHLQMPVFMCVYDDDASGKTFPSRKMTSRFSRNYVIPVLYAWNILSAATFSFFLFIMIRKPILHA